MRGIFAIIVLLITSTDLFAELNKDIYYYYNKSEIELSRKDLNDLYPESEVYLYINKQKNVYILSSMDKYPFAIMKIGERDVYVDFDGDGKIDEKLRAINVPYWVIKKNSTSVGKTKNILKSLDHYYDVYKSNKGYQDRKTAIDISYEVIGALKDTDYDNRDLYYLIYLNSLSSQGNQEWCIYALDKLDSKINSRYGLNFTHPVIYIYLIETLIKQNKLDAARKYLNYTIGIEPNNPVYKFYQYRLETDPEKAKTLYEELIKNYKEHWLVKQLK